MNPNNENIKIENDKNEDVTENTGEEDIKDQRKKNKLEKKSKKLEAKTKKEIKKTTNADKQAENKKEQIIENTQKTSLASKVQLYQSNAKLIRPNFGQPILVKENAKNILITSALPYVNNVPHLGNLIGCVLSADVYARFCRLMGENTLYVCGTDEYGTATETKALEEKVTPKELCDKFHVLHKGVYEWFDIDFDHFGRTTTETHTKITQDIFANLNANGFILKKEVDQFKCESCDFMLSDRYVYGKCYHKPCAYEEARGDQCDGCGKLCNALELINPKCKLCKGVPTRVKSWHYFLELPAVESKLTEWVNKASEDGMWSHNSTTITKAFLSEGLKSRCITRDLKWGVTVPTEDPDMKNKVFYVWFDAPIGYLSITANFIGEDKWQEWWKNPENVKLYQFMGKDNVTFHAVIFPSTLIGASQDFTLVHHLSTTEYLNYENKKFSKSHNTGVFGDSVQNIDIPSEVWRYYLLANRPETSDTDFKWDDFMAKNNNELLANLGNLINRTLVYVFKYFNKAVPKLHHDKLELEGRDKIFFTKLTEHFLNYKKALENVKIKEGLRLFMEMSSLGNSYFQENEPWVVINKDKERCETVMHILINFCRFLACLAEPYMPSFSAKLYELLRISYDEDQSRLLRTVSSFIEQNAENSHLFLVKLDFLKDGHLINDPLPLFRKITEEETAEYKKIYG